MALQLTKDEEKQILEARRAKTAQAFKPRRADEYTPEEKQTAFDKLHKLAAEIFSQLTANGYLGDDDEHWCYEAVMELLSRPDQKVWDAINKLLR